MRASHLVRALLVVARKLQQNRLHGHGCVTAVEHGNPAKPLLHHERYLAGLHQLELLVRVDMVLPRHMGSVPTGLGESPAVLNGQQLEYVRYKLIGQGESWRPLRRSRVIG